MELYENGFDDLTKCIELDSTNSRAYFAIGQGKIIKGAQDEGLSYISKAISMGSKEAEEYLIDLKWQSSKAGLIQKKHPEWTREDCDKIAAKKIWIGMTLNMLIYERGEPNRANPSNYGYGTEWQWCWDNYIPSCFYGRDDQIITSYN